MADARTAQALSDQLQSRGTRELDPTELSQVAGGVAMTDDGKTAYTDDGTQL